MKTFEELSKMKNFAQKQYELADAQFKKASLDEAIERITTASNLLAEAKEMLVEAGVDITHYAFAVKEYTLNQAIKARTDIEKTIERLA